MDDLKKKHCATGTDDENTHETLYNLKRLNEGYGSIVEKMGYTKFKPYLQRLFNSVEMLLTHEISEFKKIDAKYQDIVRQCHIYEKTLAMTKERNSCEMTSLSDSSNTYAFEDLTKVTPYLPPDLLQSTMGIGTSAMQFRLAQRRSSLTGQQFVSTPLGPQRTSKANGAAPVAKFDDDPSFLFTNSLGFQQTEKIFVDVGTDAAENSVRIEQKDVSCQIQPLYVDEQIETDRLSEADGQMQTDSIEIEEIGCQIEPIREEFSTQTTVQEQKHFSCQCFPTLNDQMTETEAILLENEAIQTDSIATKDFSSQIHPISIDQQTETTAIFTEDVALQISFDRSIELYEREIQTETVAFVESSTQFEEIEQILLPIVLSEDLPICDEIEISIERNLTIEAKSFSDQQCQTNDDNPSSSIEHATQTDPSLDRYSSSLYIIPSISPPAQCSSTLVIVPQTFSSQIDEEIQCDLTETILSIPIETKNKSKDRRSLIQQQLDEKEKQMNRIIEEYAVLYGEYESERRRNMDLAEARDRLADHIKVLSDELGDREINQEKLLIKSCQQSKLINYMLPQIDCSPTSKKKHHSANSLRRLLPKFK